MLLILFCLYDLMFYQYFLLLMSQCVFVNGVLKIIVLFSEGWIKIKMRGIRKRGVRLAAKGWFIV